MDAISTFRFKTDEDSLEIIEDYLERNGCDVDEEERSIVSYENEEYVYLNDIISMVKEMLEEVGDLDFELTGTTDCNGNEFQDFKIIKN